jgi:hypothetical protein
MSEAVRCLKCGSLNISFDLSTGEYACIDCLSTDKPKKFELEEFKQQQIEEEEKVLSGLKVMGTDVHIEKKQKEAKDLNKELNDFSQMGL